MALDWSAGWFPYSPARPIPEHWHGSLLNEKRDASGLLYRRNRYYDPSTSRFTQEDSIGLAAGLNLYGYAGGDPVNYSDPFGLCRKPRGLKKGEIGICIETFIAGPSAGVPRSTADNRGFSATGGSYRTSDRFIVQADGNVRDDFTGKGPHVRLRAGSRASFALPHRRVVGQPPSLLRRMLGLSRRGHPSTSTMTSRSPSQEAT